MASRINNGSALSTVTNSLVNLFCTVLVLLALVSLVFAWASLLTVRPAKQLEYWDKQPEEINSQLANKLLERTLFSAKLNPLDANTHLIAGQLYETLSNFNAAETHYQLAILRQPTWDYAWARLANLFHLELQSTKAVKALNQAMTLGRYENDTQKIIIPLIFEYWPFLSINLEQKEKALSVIQHSLKYPTHRNLTLNLARERGLLSILLPLKKPASVSKKVNNWLLESTK